jgi:mono/diheme cytochrome c family protein
MRSIIHLVGVAAIAAPALFASTYALAAAADADAGREAYIRAGCYSCHGYEGQGAGTGPKLAPDPLPYAALSNFVRQTSGAMPPYTPAVLPEEDLQDIYAYLQSRPAAPDPDDIPLLQDIQ